MSLLRSIAGAWLASERATIVIEVTEALGSAPREAGTRMLVTLHDIAGTVGGGHLELKAIQHARAMLRDGTLVAHSEHFPLGPTLGQCCGGAVTLAYAPLDAQIIERWPVEPPRFHLQLYGAGHVGRAIVRAISPLNVVVDWIDERDEEFPTELYEPHSRGWPPHIRKVCVDSVEAEVRTAPAGAYYLVLTHEHDLDLRISEAILKRGDFAYFGLIGSKTKRARFIRRFEQRGIDAQRIERMTCPIGVPGIDGKEPEVIAAAVVAQLLAVASFSRRTTLVDSGIALTIRA